MSIAAKRVNAVERRKGVRVPFEFAAIPHRVLDLVRERRLQYDELAILTYLYRRVNRTTWETRFTLDQLQEAIAWPKSSDWLSKRLRRLRREGLIDFESVPGQKAHRYTIRLSLHEASEEAPSSVREIAPSTDEATSPSIRPTVPLSAPQPPEQLGSVRTNESPSMSPRGPRTNDARRGALDDLPWDVGVELVRAVQSLREEPSMRARTERQGVERSGDERPEVSAEHSALIELIRLGDRPRLSEHHAGES
jgi:hypothetical protein